MIQLIQVVLSVSSLLLSLLLPSIDAASQCSFQNFCPNGVTRPNALVEAAGNGLTCQTISVGISFDMVPPEECSHLVFAEIFCCPPEEESNCFLCGNSDDNLGLYEDRIVEGETCGEINRKLQLNPREKSCNAWKGVYYDDMKSVDVKSYCGCPGMPAPNDCQLCGRGIPNDEIMELVDPAAQVPAADGYSNMTCLELLEYASHVTSSDTCGTLSTPEIQAACCAGASTSSGASSTRMAGSTTIFGTPFLSMGAGGLLLLMLLVR
ncbi:unnamed protein product [Cylindrotheca closterium]|uniref:Uncharacterized protein n=1 Tax=Cylindrotheca closterium TaxID=2856 RepID=A0AAD2G9C2_9STRA|nr:unnamed protein product [Cylindrotheca closterium]